MVQHLNLILLTAVELSDLRRLLKDAQKSECQRSRDLFVTLFTTWANNAVASFGLCLLAGGYSMACDLISCLYVQNYGFWLYFECFWCFFDAFLCIFMSFLCFFMLFMLFCLCGYESVFGCFWLYINVLYAFLCVFYMFSLLITYFLHTFTYD